MTKIIDARRKFKSRLDSKQDVSQPIPALMGDGAGNIDVDPVNQPGQVFIRVGDGDLGQAFNSRVPRADNLAIDVGYDPITDPDRRVFQVLNVRMSDYAGAGNTPFPNVGPHHELHEFGGGDDVYVSWRRLMGFRVGRPSAFTVTVDEGNIIRAGAWLAVLAQTLNLAASQAALLGAQARYVLITLNSAGVAAATAGAIVAVGALDISDCPIPAAGEIPLAAVRLYGTQTSIGDVPTAPDIIDLRFPQAASTGTVFLSSLQPGTAQYQIITSGANPYPATWSGFYVRGTAGGTTNLDVAAAQTLTLISASSLSLTAERTGAVIVRLSGAAPAPQIVGDSVGAGNARGQYAVDLQLSRINAISVASGDYASILGGLGNQASGNRSVVVGGSGNIASGLNSFVGGGLNADAAGDYSYSSGSNCQALGNYSYAIGRQARTGANAGVFIWADSTAANFNGLIADEFAIRARGGFRHAYDDSNYWQATVSAAGAVTFNATGASAGFAFSDVVTVPSLNLTAASNQVVFQSGGVTGTLTWTPAASNKVVTIPNVTGNAAIDAYANIFTIAQKIIVADAAATLRVAGATGLLRFFGYYDATFGALIQGMDTAETGYVPLSLYGTPICIPLHGLHVGGTSNPGNKNLMVDGDQTFSGAGSGLPYGSCYGNEIGWSQAAAVQNTWYNISDADMADGHGGLNLVTHDGSGKLTVINAGRYLINYSVTLEASVANDHIMCGIELNGTGTAINDAQQHWDSVANKEITMGSTAIVSLAASGYFEISVRTTDANSPTITVSHLNISVIMVGG